MIGNFLSSELECQARTTCIDFCLALVLHTPLSSNAFVGVSGGRPALIQMWMVLLVVLLHWCLDSYFQIVLVSYRSQVRSPTLLIVKGNFCWFNWESVSMVLGFGGYCSSLSRLFHNPVNATLQQRSVSTPSHLWAKFPTPASVPENSIGQGIKATHRPRGLVGQLTAQNLWPATILKMIFVL